MSKIKVAKKLANQISKAAKKSRDDLKKSQKKRSEAKEAKAKREKFIYGDPRFKRKNLRGTSGLKRGTEEALAKAAVIGVGGTTAVTALIGGLVAADRKGRRLGRERKERLHKMEELARKARSKGMNAFTYEGERYGLDLKKLVKKADGGWIQGAIKKPGALKKQMGVPKDEKIPAAKLNAAAKKGGKLGQRARLAKTLRGFKHGGEVTHTRWENKWN